MYSYLFINYQSCNIAWLWVVKTTIIFNLLPVLFVMMYPDTK